MSFRFVSLSVVFLVTGMLATVVVTGNLASSLFVWLIWFVFVCVKHEPRTQVKAQS